MQVSLQAVPETARQQTAELAGQIYRQVRDLGVARQENLTRPERVADVVAKSGVTFRGIQSTDDRNQRTHRETKEIKSSERNLRELRGPYAPMGRTLFKSSSYEENSGANLDFVA
jgi:hypothetical protein